MRIWEIEIMGRDVVVLGVGMTRIGKFMERSFKDLTREAVDTVIKDAGDIKKPDNKRPM